MTTVSALMIARDEERHIERAIEALLLQEYLPDEIVVIDDGSQDRTHEIVMQITRGSPVRVVVERTRGVGRGAAMNIAIAVSTGDILVVCDADDESLPTRIACHVNAFSADPMLDWHFGQLRFMDSVGTYFGRSQYPTNPTEIRRRLLDGRMPLPHAASAFRRRILPAHPEGPYAPTINRVMDLEMLLAHGTQWRITGSNEVVLAYRRERIDLGLGGWVKYRKAHHYAVYHGAARRRGEPPEPFAIWWSAMSMRERAIRTDVHRFLAMRTQTLVGRYAPSLSRLRRPGDPGPERQD